MNERLGRGLSALIPSEEHRPQKAGIGTVSIKSIKPNRYQPRKFFDPDKLAELSQSIQENGIIQPLIVTKAADSDSYELIAGERRLEAAKMAGLEQVPVVIRSVSDKEQLQLAIIENVQRQDLDPIEEALAYQSMAEEFNYTHQQIAQVIGKERVTISNSIRLLKLPLVVLEYISSGELSAGHGRAILMAQEMYQEAFAAHIIKYQLTVRQAEDKAKDYSPLKGDEVKPYVSPQVKILEEELAKLFKLKVKVVDNKGRGKITLNYRKKEELDYLLEVLEQFK